MRNAILASAVGSLFVAWLAVAQVSPSDPVTGAAPGGNNGAQTEIQPGKVGPGSEKNSEVAPTSPSIPTYAQPPPEIPPAQSGETGSSTGEGGKSGQGKAPPYNPSSPGLR